MNVIKNLKKLASNSRGVTAIEFALLALPFFGLIIGTIQLGVIFLANQTLDEAVDVASRGIQTGQIQTSGNINDFRTSICDRVSVISDCENNIQLSVRSFLDFDAVETASNNGELFTSAGKPIIVNNTFSPGGGGEIVVVSASVFIPVVVGAILSGSTNNGMQLSTSLAFKNESF